MVKGLKILIDHIFLKTSYDSSNWPAMNEYENMIGKHEWIVMIRFYSFFLGV